MVPSPARRLSLLSRTPSHRSHPPRGRLSGLWGLGLRTCVWVPLVSAITLVFTAAALADVDYTTFIYTNHSGVKVSDLEVSYILQPGGSLLNPTVSQQPAGAPTPLLTVVGDEVHIDWQGPAIDNGQTVSLTIQCERSLLDTQFVWWTEYGNVVSGPLGNRPLWPVASKPAIIGNFGTVEDSSLHGGLDIAEAVNQPVRAMMDLTIVGVPIVDVNKPHLGNYIYLSDGTNLYAIAHIKETLAAHWNDFDPQPYVPGGEGDVGRTILRGDIIGYVTGRANPGGGTFDHIHLECSPDCGTIKNPDGTYMTLDDIWDLARPKRSNPLTATYDGGTLFMLKDPSASDNQSAPEIGPIFWRPVENDHVGGFTEFGNAKTATGVRRGTFVNGHVDIIQQITDDQGAALPTADHTRQDTKDTTIPINEIVVSDPYKVSYKVTGTGVVAGHDIAERTLVEFNQAASVYNDATVAVIYDIIFDIGPDAKTRNVEPPASPPDLPETHPLYNHCYILTNTNGAAPTAANSWNTMAKANPGNQADGTGAQVAQNNAEAMFPDGIYEVEGFGYDVGGGLVSFPANKTSTTYLVRVNNWQQTAVPGSLDNSPPARATETFSKDGQERSVAHVFLSYGDNSDVFAQGKNYLGGQSYDAYVTHHKPNGWKEGDPYMSGDFRRTVPADGNGEIPWLKIVNTEDLGGVGKYDLTFDYDDNAAFSWTLDGLGAFEVKIPGSTLKELRSGVPTRPWNQGDSWEGGGVPGAGATAFAINGMTTDCQTVVDGNVTVSALYVSGPDAAMCVKIQNGANLSISNYANVVDGGCLDLNGGSLNTPEVRLNGGSLVGNGTVTVGQRVRNRGLVSPGHSAGTITIVGNYVQEADGVLLMELAGTGPGQFDRLIVNNGMMNLAGTLDVDLINGFVPGWGQSFDLLDWQSLVGKFTTLDLPALSGNLTWDTGNLYSTGGLAITPEPATLALVALGGLGLAWRRPRRRAGR